MVAPATRIHPHSFGDLEEEACNCCSSGWERLAMAIGRFPAPSKRRGDEPLAKTM